MNGGLRESVRDAKAWDEMYSEANIITYVYIYRIHCVCVYVGVCVQLSAVTPLT